MSPSNNRQIVRWENIKGPKALFALTIATALGAGLIPLAPGTWGSIVAMPLAYFTLDWSLSARLLLWLGLTAIGTWAATTFDQTMKTADNQCIVIDEVIGLGITAWTIAPDLKSLVVAFVLFRFFDVIKIPPVWQVDRWSKKMSKSSAFWGGFGVIADDILAGFQGLLIMILLQALHILK